ncbi:hypothetical protein F0562_017353 [Nyssa sinensis]|uniref:Uncharacterized protein n=1 Tax=Nyssa sinensis TaxID=561372 RepID=A0A5J4ZFP4_9ASTE|nr:hypothetical protein F0562_017353 [Nyssa sinensis]
MTIQTTHCLSHSRDEVTAEDLQLGFDNFIHFKHDVVQNSTTPTGQSRRSYIGSLFSSSVEDTEISL